MRIAISMRVTNAVEYYEPRDALSHDWQRWLNDHGHRFWSVPNFLEDVPAYLDDLRADAVILSGGNDAKPTPGNAKDLSAQRTQTELALIDAATERGLPVLGTCRGLHVVNLRFGGEITADIATLPNTAGHVAHNHEIRISAPFDGIAKSSQMTVNSFHNQGVMKNQLGAALHPFAFSSDGLVEGLVHAELPILAIQWHPERSHAASDFDNRLIAQFFRDGAFWSTALPACKH